MDINIIKYLMKTMGKEVVAAINLDVPSLIKYLELAKSRALFYEVTDETIFYDKFQSKNHKRDLLNHNFT